MRTRFLAADYFAPAAPDASSSDQALALAALPFPSLPVPVLPPDPYLPDPDPFPADLLPYPSVAGDDIYSFPVASALSDFLAAVIPRPLPVDIPGADEGLDGISRENCEEGTSLGTSTVTKGGELLKEFKFEVIEINFLQVLQNKLALLDGEESDGGVTLSCRVPEVKFHLDFIDMDTEITIPYPVELAESIYQVEKIPVKQDVDGDCSDARDSDRLEIAKLDHDVMIPQLEISRHAWELDECSTKAEISNIFLSVVEHLNDGSQVPHPAFDSTEFLKSDVDMLSLVCKDAPHVDCQKDESITAKAVAEMDLVKINGNILLDKKSAIYPLKPDGTCSDLPCFVPLEEVEIVDFPSKDAFEMLAQSEKAEMKTSDEIFKNDFDSARRFYESVVSSELALSDADGIFLDWHLLVEGPCNREICSTYAGMVEEVKPCSLKSELKICQQTSDLGIDFLEDIQRSPKVRHEDRKNEVYVPATLSHDPPSIPETAYKYRKENDDRDQSHLEKLNLEKASSLFESMSRSDGLNFYLNGRSDTNGVKNNEIVATLDIPPSKQQSIPVSTRPRVDKLIQIYPVTLSDLIRGLIKDIHVSYTSALRESAYLRNLFSDEQGLGISKQKLLELITGEGSHGLYNDCKLEEKLELIVLYALKQIAYYLCFFGLHAAHLYIGNLTGSFENIPERLRNIQCCIGAAQLIVERQLLESHPSLSSIEAILRSNTQIGQKILIVSDRAFWLPLGQKLTSMKMTSVELGKYPAATYADPLTETSSKTWALKDLWKSDCILLDNKDIPASFPFCEFGIILEYGGPNESSTLLSVAPKLNSLPPLHFLYVKMDAEDFPVALIEDNCTDQDLKSTMKSSSTSSVSANDMKVHQDNNSASDFPSSVKIDSIMSGRLAAPEVVIVVNTGDHGKYISSALLHSPSKRRKRALQDVSVPINDPLRANTLNQLCGDYVEHDKIFSPSKMKKFSNMEDTLPKFPDPEVFMFDYSLNLGSENVSHQQGKRVMNAVTGNQMIYDDFNNVLTPNLRTYNERTSSMVDMCNYSSQSEFGGTKPIQSTFATRRPSLDRACGHLRFPTALEINNDLGEWDIPCGINETWSGQLHGDFATSSCRDYPGSRYHESGEEMMQNPASSLAFMKQDFGSNRTSQGLGWERDFLRQMNERRISRQGRDRCKASAMLSNPRMRDGSSRILRAPPLESFRYKRNARTPSKDQSPSSNGAHSYGPTGSVRYQITIDTPGRDQGASDGAHRFGNSREGARVQSNRVRRDFMIQPSINHEKSIIPSMKPSWTPVDKRARQKLSYTTYGKEKQSKLVWRHQDSPDVGSGSRKRSID
ncbi:hypothetical protein PR202_ga02136 [Eleusine coracana subsp. coracana]|uniref:Uncharacterized protein n=1 Tax=Eleusine coracana subsp. coracana TaxID=191504 RepID=A0AAV5BJY7_ELECO|nr:hypothetical protein PR202_ga01449 [Eleusine coracana subsp. coracana]GJM86291.1 hypothetical protein PR202_ga02136 [Eleusine coracana subsp. coracana]